MNFLTPQFRVGSLVLGVSALIAFMSMKVSEDPSGFGRSRKAWFLIEDASGLVKSSAVKMAGISVGVIKDIKLQDGMAHVDLSLRSDIPLTTSAKVEVRANGILGDKHVELLPGNPSDPPLRHEGQIVYVEDRGSMDALLNEVGKITKSLGSVADSLKAATTGEGDTSQPLGRIVRNIEELTADLAELSSERKGQIGEIVEQIHNVTSTLDEFVSDESDEGFKAALKRATNSLSRIDKALKNVEEITDKINRGEGTIGRLVNDETTVEELNTAIAGVNDYIDAGNKLATSIDFHSYYLTHPGLAKSFVSLRLQPGLDRYYEIGIVDDPKGVVETVDTKTTQGNAETNVTETKRYYNRIKFNALFAKNFGDLTIKGGLIESAGGVGVDYHLWRRRIAMSLEAFRFSNTNVRATARYNFFKGIYLIGGADDIFSKGDYSSFIGAGIFLTNDDLKLLFSKMPF